MTTRFILDHKLKNERETIEKILSLANKKPYPTKETTHLATFISYCFYSIESVKRQELAEKLAKEKQKEWEEAEIRRKKEEEIKLKSLEMEAPIPQALQLGDLNELELEVPSLPGTPIITTPKVIEQPKEISFRTEYVLNIYDTPIGVLIEKDDYQKYKYHIIEPHFDQQIVENAKKKYAKDFEKNNSLFDDHNFIAKILNKTSSKTDEISKRNLKYYLERDILGAGKIDPFLYDDKINTIKIEGLNKKIKVKIEGFEEMESNISINDNKDINKLMERVGQATHIPINNNNPILDVKFQGLKFEGVLGLGDKTSKLTIRRLKNDF